LGQEPEESVDWAYAMWRIFAILVGWDIPNDKSPMPAPSPRALGAIVNYGNATSTSTTIKLCPLRIKAILSILEEAQTSKCLPPQTSESLHGKLMHASDQLFGLVGRAHTRAFRRRAHEPGRDNLNPQLEASITWWRHHLATSPPREVPLRIGDIPLVVSYGDGEGADGRIGIVLRATFYTDGLPRVGSALTPAPVRRYWARQRAQSCGPTSPAPSDAAKDIQQIEGILPAVILHNFPQISHCLWLHFVDNNGALGGLVKGSASIHSDEVILGYTWSQTAQRRVWAYFDRVDTESNIADIPSRQPVKKMVDLLGMPYQSFRLKFPQELVSAIQSSLDA